MSEAWLGTFVPTLLVVGLAMLAMGVGMLFGRRAPAGRCGSPAGCACDPRRRACRTPDESANVSTRAQAR